MTKGKILWTAQGYIGKDSRNYAQGSGNNSETSSSRENESDHTKSQTSNDYKPKVIIAFLHNFSGVHFMKMLDFHTPDGNIMIFCPFKIF